MFYHNDVVRKEFQIPMKSNSEWLDGSWDACAEWYILSKYVRLYSENTPSIYLSHKHRKHSPQSVQAIGENHSKHPEGDLWFSQKTQELKLLICVCFHA